MAERYDVIVVGGGGSGAPLAARVAEDPDLRVLLLEAGPALRDVHAYPRGLQHPGTVQCARPGHPCNWSFPAELMPGTPYSLARGRVLGGSTAINGGYFIRAPREDFDRWSRVGGPAWSFEEATRIYSRLEADRDFGSLAGHGATGPVPVRRPPQTHPISRAFRQAALDLGFADEPDKNADGLPGVGPVPMNVTGDVRWNTALTYLGPGQLGANLEIRGGALVRKVLFEGTRTVGVEVLHGGQVTVIPGNEVVLCAGAVQSAHLLLVSGIGRASALAAEGITVVADRPGVGSGLTDHPQVSVQWRPRQGVVDNDIPRIMESCLNFASEDGRGADLEIIPLLKPMDYLLSGMEPGRGTSADLELLVALQSEESRGRLTLNSRDPAGHPRIEYNYLAEESDLRRLRVGVRTAAALLCTQAFEPLVETIVEPLPHVLADDQLLDDWVRARLGTAQHMSGTAKMGPPENAEAVVDPYGRVHGVSGLRVADTSILPTAPLRGPSATAVLIGELVAGHLRGTYLRHPAIGPGGDRRPADELPEGAVISQGLP